MRLMEEITMKVYSVLVTQHNRKSHTEEFHLLLDRHGDRRAANRFMTSRTKKISFDLFFPDFFDVGND